MSPLYMKSLFIKTYIAHELRDFIPLIQSKFNTSTYSYLYVHDIINISTHTVSMVSMTTIRSFRKNIKK